MYHRLFLVAALLSSCAGEYVVPVLAFAGADVILPCSVNIPDSGDFPTVEWSRERLQPNVVLLYRDGCETPEMKNPAFRYRTSLLTGELNKGNLSLRISGVRLSDAGTFRCMRLWGNGARDVGAVELAVAAVSDPELSAAPLEDGGVEARCEARCWLPEPQIHFLDQQGNLLPAQEPEREEEQQEAGGCVTVRRRLVLHRVPDRISCRVEQRETNQSRAAELHLPVDRKSCLLPAALSAAGTLLLVSVTAGLVVFCLWRRFSKSASGKHLPLTPQRSDSSTGSGSSSENQLLMRVRSDGSEVVIEGLTEQISQLQTKLQERDRIIRRLQNNHRRPQISPAACSPAARPSRPEPGNVPQHRKRKPGILRQHSNPSPERPIRTIHRNHSSPALVNLAVSAPEKKPGHVSRSLSDAHVRPGPTAPDRRRHSSVFPFSAPQNNLGKRLDSLSEESEVLIPNIQLY